MPIEAVCKIPSDEPPKLPKLTSTSPLILYDIVLPPIYSKVAMTSGLFRTCSDINM
jgi:hypothetical protein